MVEKKEVDYKKKFEKCKRIRKKDQENYMQYRETLNKHYSGQIKELQEKLKEKEQPRYTISLHEQTLSVKSIADAKEKIKALVDLGFWFFNVGES